MKTSKKIIELILTVILSIATFAILFIIFWVYSIPSDEKISDDYKKYEVSDDGTIKIIQYINDVVVSSEFDGIKLEMKKSYTDGNNSPETASLLVMGTVTIIILIYKKKELY